MCSIQIPMQILLSKVFIIICLKYSSNACLQMSKHFWNQISGFIRGPGFSGFSLGLYHLSLPGRGECHFFLFLLVVGVKPCFFMLDGFFFLLDGGGGKVSEISGVPPSQVYLNGTALRQVSLYY